MRRALTVLTAALVTIPAALFAGPGAAHAATVEAAIPLDRPAWANWGGPAASNAEGTMVGAIGHTGAPVPGAGPRSTGACSLRAARWNGSALTVLPTPADGWSRAYGINLGGVAVGFVSRSADPSTPACSGRPEAELWTADGRAVPLAPGYDGITVATAVNDIGEIVGFATPPGAPGSVWLIDVRFAGGQVIPLAHNPLDLSSDGMDLESALGTSSIQAPGPVLSNMADRNFVAGSAVAGSLGAYVYAIDPGSFISQGDFRFLPATPQQPGSSAVNAAVSISSDRTTILGLETGATQQSVLWHERYRSGHPGHALTVPAPPPGHDPAWAAVMSPDASMIAAFPQGGSDVVWIRTGLTSGWVTVPNAAIYGITDTGKAYGTDAHGAPATWRLLR